MSTSHANPYNSYHGLTSQQDLSSIKLGKRKKASGNEYYRVSMPNGNLKVLDLPTALSYKSKGYQVSKVTVTRL